MFLCCMHDCTIYFIYYLAVSCGRPELLANGTIVGSSFNSNDVITYRCNDGFGLSGPPQRTCLISGEWSGISPKCLCKNS